MNDPAPLERRFSGNIILVPDDSGPVLFPDGNLLTRGPIRFADPKNGNYQLTSPRWTKTSDGKPPGVDARALSAAVGDASTPISGH